jgi:hypothetical protein
VAGARSGSMSKWEKNESAGKPGSVVDNHSSAIRVTTYLKRPTRESVWATHAAQSEDWTARSPIWSCSGRGLPCHRVLPPARCALTAPFHPYRRVAEAARLGGLLSVALSVDSRPPGVTWRLALGARTFLHPCKQEQRLSGRLGAHDTEAGPTLRAYLRSIAWLARINRCVFRRSTWRRPSPLAMATAHPTTRVAIDRRSGSARRSFQQGYH